MPHRPAGYLIQSVQLEGQESPVLNPLQNMVNDTITLFSDSSEVGRSGHNLLKENNIHLAGHAHAGLQGVEVIITTLALWEILNVNVPHATMQSHDGV